MVQGSLLRLAGLLLAAIVGWTLLRAYTGTLFLICIAMAGWRLWRVAADMPARHRPVDLPKPSPPRPAGPSRPAAPPFSSAPTTVPVFRPSRSLERALAELDGMVGLASVKAEVRKPIDVLAAERERARHGHSSLDTRNEPPCPVLVGLLACDHHHGSGPNAGSGAGRATAKSVRSDREKTRRGVAPVESTFWAASWDRSGRGSRFYATIPLACA